MDFRLSPAQETLRDQARRLLDTDFSTAHVREAEVSPDGFARGVWEAGCELGWSGIAISPEHGGSGQGLLELCVLLEELGRAAATAPVVPAAGVAVAMLQHSPPGEMRDRVLGSIAAGAIIVPALIDANARNEWDPPTLGIAADGEAQRWTGTKVLVPFGSVADELLVTGVCSRGSTTIAAIDASADGITITKHASKVGVPLAAIDLLDVQVPAERVIHEGEDADRAIRAALDVGSLLATAEAVGMCEALITLTAAHVSEREAFGRALGSFQAVAHPCADMRIAADAVRILTQHAAWQIDNGRSAAEEIPATKALANELFATAGNDAYRLHGALGFSTECDVQLYLRRLQGFFGSLGESQESFERAATAMGL